MHLLAMVLSDDPEEGIHDILRPFREFLDDEDGCHRRNPQALYQSYDLDGRYAGIPSRCGIDFTYRIGEGYEDAYSDDRDYHHVTKMKYVDMSVPFSADVVIGVNGDVHERYREEPEMVWGWDHGFHDRFLKGDPDTLVYVVDLTDDEGSE